MPSFPVCFPRGGGDFFPARLLQRLLAEADELLLLLFSFGLVVLQVQSRTNNNMPREIKLWDYFPYFISAGGTMAVEGRILLQV